MQNQTQFPYRRSHLACPWTLFWAFCYPLWPLWASRVFPTTFLIYDRQGLQASKPLSNLGPLPFSDRLLSTWLHLKMSCLINFPGLWWKSSMPSRGCCSSYCCGSKRLYSCLSTEENQSQLFMRYSYEPYGPRLKPSLSSLITCWSSSLK